MTKRIGEGLVWMAVVTALGSCTGQSADPSARAGAPSASLAPVSTTAAVGSSAAPVAAGTGSAEPAASSAEPAASSAEPAASSAPSASDLCPQAPAPVGTTGSTLEFSTELTMGGVPFVYGEPNALEGGGTLLPLNFRFYVSEVALIRADSTEVKVDIVTDAGAPIHYGVHLVNAEEPESLRFRVLAPPGSYTGASFLLGVKDACNGGFAEHEPFSDASGMTWPPPFGYLFLRYEGTVTPGDAGAPPPGTADAGAPPPGAVHMGGLKGTLLAPRVQAPGNFAATDAAASMRLVFDVGELMRAATSSLDVSDYPAAPVAMEEVLRGERVRRLAPELSLFTLVPQ